MSRRGFEFTDKTKSMAYDQYGGCCAKCQKSLHVECQDSVHLDVEFHHRVGISWLQKHFPLLSSVIIKSVANCMPLHHDCHVETHRSDTDLGLLVLAMCLRCQDTKPML